MLALISAYLARYLRCGCLETFVDAFTIRLRTLEHSSAGAVPKPTAEQFQATFPPSGTASFCWCREKNGTASSGACCAEEHRQITKKPRTIAGPRLNFFRRARSGRHVQPTHYARTRKLARGERTGTMADELEGWDEREAEERRKQMRQQGLPTYEAAGVVRVLSTADSLPEGYRAVPIPPFGGFDSFCIPINGSDRFDDDPPEGGRVLPIPPATDADPKVEPLGEWDAGDDDQLPPPRGWLLGNSFCRGFVSSLLGDGGVGKTATRYAQALSLAIKRALTGEHVFQRCRVLIVSLEDGRDEQRRRIQAACLHHGIKREELKGWLFLAALDKASGKLMTLDQYGRPVLGALAAKLARTIAARKIDLVILDPFVKAHTINENDNSAIDEVAQILTDMSVRFDIAVDVPHHISKGPADPGNANRGRGASSSKDAFRLVDTATRMSEEEGKAFGLSEAERRSLIRIDNAKVNIAPTANARWLKLVSVNIGNGTDLYPSGDSVQTVEPWSPPGLFASISVPVLNAILDNIDAGLPDGNRYSDAPSVTDRAAWRVIERHCGKGEGPARQIIKAWVESGLLIHHSYENPVTRKPVKGLRVDPIKRPS
ncbi:hypothetical protein ABID65_006559 [Bradyrhizobium sp. S3.9.2]|uniref:AAA family ATPase n=1 Tax=Bradyrhizobium sp. S3.9.2 TaxID=3156432 RepID=UPI003394181B